MAQRTLDAWEKVLADEEAEWKKEEQVLQDLAALRQEQSRNGITNEERIEQFEKLAELYVNNGRPFAAQLMQKEAHDCRRLHRQAHENNRLRKARAREAQQKEHARIAKLREIGTVLGFTESEFQNLLATRKFEQSKRSGAFDDDQWGVGWATNQRKSTSKSATKRWQWPIRMIIQWLEWLMTWFIVRQPPKDTVAENCDHN
mmetsp:Transcript_17703/g.33851  ORF Transcript_17703/g.33851 Transcript_17703/m.33851 type:complete len:202 (-) Transcript_17703:475-1080(-)